MTQSNPNNPAPNPGDAALHLAERGLSVFPLHTVVDGRCSCRANGCDRAGKHPRTKNGLKDASRDPKQIREWWARWPDANIGIATGPEFDLWMVGPDGTQGQRDLAELERRHGQLPRTWQAQSGSSDPGRHFFFRWPDDGDPIKNRQNHLGTKIDVRGSGGYAVAAPSLHPDGNHYSWIVSPDETPPAPAPLWLVDWARQDKSRTRAAQPATARANHTERGVIDRAIKYLAKCPPAVSGQGGHDQTFAVARAIVWGFDLGPEAGYDLLARHYNPSCQPPWTEAELRHKCCEADTVPYERHRGWLLNQDRPTNGYDHHANGHHHASNGAAKRQPAPDSSGGHEGDGADIPPSDQEAAACESEPASESVREAPDDPHRLARGYRDANEAEKHPVLYWRDEHYRYRDGGYRLVQDKDIKAELTSHIKTVFDADYQSALRDWEEKGGQNEDGKPIPKPLVRKVTVRLVSDTMQALNSLIHLSSDAESPSWIEDPGPQYADCEPANMLAFPNGLGDIRTLATESIIYDPTPRFFTQNALAYRFIPDAPPPREWLKFLDQLWHDDKQIIETLQEWFGYTLVPDTSQQKILLPVGPKRSGKGTIARVMRAVVGEANCCAPTLAGLGTNFGLQPLLGKTLAIIGDARLSARTDTAIVTERLLSISGEDAVTIDRKFLGAVTTRLSTRFVIITNELPRLTDNSGALASRFIVLPFTKSFYGQEDHALTTRLLRELPGILLWAFEGWLRLQERGHFVQPEAGKQAIGMLEELASPVGAFVSQCCEVSPTHEAPIPDVFEAWEQWCTQVGRNATNEQVLGRDLRSVIPTLSVGHRRRENGERIRVYRGIRLRREGYF